MAIIKYDPFRGFDSLARRMNNLMNNYDRGLDVNYGQFDPKVDITDDEKHLYIHAEMPGIKKEDIKVTVSDENVLVIKGKKENETKEEDKKRNYLRMERSYGEFTRSFALPENVNTEDIQAKFEDGVLNLTFEKTEPEQPKERQIEIA